MTQRRKFPVLHLYATPEEATEAFTKAIKELSFVRCNHRDRFVEIGEYVMYFQNISTDKNEKHAALYGQWCRIYFHCELQLELKQRYLSRIRLFD